MNWDVRRFDVLDSTNRFVIEEAEKGVAEGLVVVAGHQTAGRGRHKRVWDSKPGASLLFSVLFRPRDVVAPFRLTQALALGVTDACRVIAGFDAQLKWPNDIVVEDRKLGGVLGEAVSEGDAVRALAVGCGMNLNWEGSLPAALAATAVSADELAGHRLDADQMLEGILRSLNERLARPTWVLEAYRQRCSTLGRRVMVEPVRGGAFEGTAVDVTDEGSLVVEDDSGRRHEVAAAEVTHLRTN